MKNTDTIVSIFSDLNKYQTESLSELNGCLDTVGFSVTNIDRFLNQQYKSYPSTNLHMVKNPSAPVYGYQKAKNDFLGFGPRAMYMRTQAKMMHWLCDQSNLNFIKMENKINRSFCAYDIIGMYDYDKAPEVPQAFKYVVRVLAPVWFKENNPNPLKQDVLCYKSLNQSDTEVSWISTNSGPVLAFSRHCEDTHSDSLKSVFSYNGTAFLYYHASEECLYSVHKPLSLGDYLAFAKEMTRVIKDLEIPEYCLADESTTLEALEGTILGEYLSSMHDKARAIHLKSAALNPDKESTYSLVKESGVRIMVEVDRVSFQSVDMSYNSSFALELTKVEQEGAQVVCVKMPFNDTKEDPCAHLFLHTEYSIKTWSAIVKANKALAAWQADPSLGFTS